MRLSLRSWDIPAVCVRLSILAMLAGTTGCGGPGHGKVSGRVLFDGAPLQGGKVYFRPVDGRAELVTVELRDSAQFSVELPVGEVLVCVDNRDLEPRKPTAPATFNLPPAIRKVSSKLGGGKSPTPPPAPPADPTPAGSGKYVKLPEKYYSPDSSGLTFTVQAGDQQHDITLQSK